MRHELFFLMVVFNEWKWNFRIQSKSSDIANTAMGLKIKEQFLSDAVDQYLASSVSWCVSYYLRIYLFGGYWVFKSIATKILKAHLQWHVMISKSSINYLWKCSPSIQCIIFSDISISQSNFETSLFNIESRCIKNRNLQFSKLV